ncbi:hypothetical protein COU86_01245 [Candidatus Roizmanbacteria bacterium CG10_big_fil_rev_8_21_14_0_10_36_26]|uniref:DUF4349 domain-containing protein n=1 Tax=Candidatus Roizmanbacteria bacterium CG10_big_fil_rev_8_21_14_0_10_36_26 TaxID=1974851 RepID=A0A2M8KM96_9BACT|nr:MAG: hypothetical protein COU86_01245 [Candidatus Roizmanbacteria bacterium CG10_big_fil_rev_8_21_14_0_10_36_26]
MVNWIKTHKLICVLMAIIIYLLAKNSIFLPRTYLNSSSNQGNSVSSLQKMAALPYVSGGNLNDIMPPSESAPNANIKNRLVITNSYLSLQVSKVAVVQKQVIKKAEELGGYMVNSSIENPSDVASATVTVRIPSKQLENALQYYRSLSIKVISENLQGDDVTDQYVDFAAQLKTYEKTKAIFEQMLDKATNIQDILEVQREIINVQSSIDSIKGQMDYLKKNAEMAKITLYLSTDELALPYAPTDTWRPSVIFKQAVRSLVGTVRRIGSLAIWIGVYAIIWVPILLIVLYIRRKRRFS